MTTRRPNHVPKFGNWDANDHVPFTKVFESARAGKGANNKLINPNDPLQNPEGFGLRVANEENMIAKPFGDAQRPVDVQKNKGVASGMRNNGGFSNGVGGDRPSAVHQGRFNNRPNSSSSSPSRDVKVPSEAGTATKSRHGGSKGNETMFVSISRMKTNTPPQGYTSPLNINCIGILLTSTMGCLGM